MIVSDVVSFYQAQAVVGYEVKELGNLFIDQESFIGFKWDVHGWDCFLGWFGVIFHGNKIF